MLTSRISLWLTATWLLIAGLIAAANCLLPADHWLYLSDYWLTLAGKILCYAVVALAMDLIWGYTGILSLGQGVFFALGGYAFGLYLTGSQSFGMGLLFSVLAPGILAWVFGFFAFRSRIKGVYFSIITQAMTLAFMLLFLRNDTGFGGNNGLTDFKQLLGIPLAAPGMRASLFLLSALFLAGSYWLCRYIALSPLGRILMAVRDSESRLRFCGYSTLKYKLFIWTFAAVLCGLAGALYVPQVGIINPSEMHPANSIEIAIWTAIGGRGSLIGPIIGAGLINGAKSFFTVVLPEFWLLFLGLIFIIAPIYLPKGLMGLLSRSNKA